MSKLDEVADWAGRVTRGEVPETRDKLLRVMTADAPTTELYNRFLFLWAQRTSPDLIVETGTDRGRAGAHMAMGCRAATVFSIDIDSACSAHLDALQLPNVETITENSLTAAHRFADRSIDLLFLDSLHEYDHMVCEVAVYMPKVKAGALVFVDDIHLNSGMDRLWSEISRPKQDISALHFSGFGVFQV